MYRNLQAVLHQKGISLKQYAAFLGVGEKAARRKLQGISDFTYLEFQKTCAVLLPEYHADYLFARDASMQLT